MKQVRETEAGKAIAAYIVLKNGKEVARVHAHFADSGNVQVDVWDDATIKAGNGPQQKKAGGYGYDKFTACLDGMIIDGIRLYNHCGQPRTETDQAMFDKLLALHWKQGAQGVQDLARPYGLTFTNYEDGKYGSLYMISGLDRLTAMGYTVIQAI